MEPGIFVTLGVLVFKLPLIKFAYPIGILAIFVLFLVMPIRAAWTAYRYFRPGRTTIDQTAYSRSILFLLIAVYAVVELVVVAAFARSGSGAISFVLPAWALAPFMFYLLFEWFRLKAHKGVRK